MHSFALVPWAAVVVAGGVGGRVLQAPAPVITPAPSLESAVYEMVKRDGPDALSLAEVLLTAVPEWIREIAATNIPAASTIISSEFLDGNRPWWFSDLPEEIQLYLIEQFGPKTAAPYSNPTIPSVVPSLTASLGPQSSAPVSSAAMSSEPQETTSAATSQSARSNAAQSSQASDTTSGMITKSTASATSTSASKSQTTISSRTTKLLTSGVTLSTAYAAPSVSTTGAPPAPSSSDDGLSRTQKIGIGLGVPLGIAGAAAFLFACCFLLRRKRRRVVDGSVPPSSPGFIPRFSFQEKPTDLEQRPLNGGSTAYTHDWNNSAWDDDAIEPMHDEPVAPTAQQPVFTPALFHTHSSNRARGKRTSYTSLHSVAELSEPDEVESPVLPRETPPRISPTGQAAARQSPRLPSLTIPPAPAAAQIKRKPVGSPPGNSPAAQTASQTLLRQTMGGGHSPYRHGRRPSLTATSPVSPIAEHDSRNPFRNSSSYVEDYGPEYHNGYVDDIEDGMYGGHTSLSRYPEQKSSKTEWPLRNTSRYKSSKSPLWDRVYDG